MAGALEDQIRQLTYGRSIQFEYALVRTQTFAGRVCLQETVYEGPLKLTKFNADLHLESPDGRFLATANLNGMEKVSGAYGFKDEFNDVTHEVTISREFRIKK